MPPASLIGLDRGNGGALVPAAVGGADAGAMHLEAELDRLGGQRPPAAAEAGQRAGNSGEAKPRHPFPSARRGG